MPYWKRALFVKLEQACGRFTDLLFCQSAEDALLQHSRALLLQAVLSPLEMVWTHNALTLRSTCSGIKVRSSLGIPSDAFVGGLIGRQVREKGIGEFLRAMTSLADRHQHLWVLLVGERLESDHDSGIARSFATTQALLGNRLVALGARDDILEVLAAMDLFCLPLWREGMPRTIIEAMMMAKPVVATNIRGAREEVVHGETGLLVPVKSSSGIATAVEKSCSIRLGPGS